MKARASVVVIGGGVVGCGVLWHLARRGVRDAVLVERGELTSGSTWHAAGNCPAFATGWSAMRFQSHGVLLYAGLAAETGYPINHHVTGSIRLARTQARMDEFRHVAGMARRQGLGFEMLAPAEIRERHPFVATDGVLGGLWDPHDGDIDPSQATQAFARGARDAGAEIYRFTRVEGLEPRPGGGWTVHTDKGSIAAGAVVNAAGFRGGEVAAMAGHELPLVSMAHQYLVTEPVPELAGRAGKLPLLRDPDDSYYLRQEGDGLVLGVYERRPSPRWIDGLPDDFAFQLYPDDMERIEWHVAQACARAPILGSVGVRRTINGPIPYAPDGLPLVGPARGLRDFYHCCAFSFGIAQAGGAGKVIAEYILDGAPEWDMWAIDPRRYAGYATKAYAVARAVETYGNEYAIAFPDEERPAGRPALASPLYGALRARGAVFGARGGWERATRFAAAPEDAREEPSFRRPRWFEAVGAECRAVRDRAGAIDLPGFSKFVVSGPGAAGWLDGMVCGRLPREGRVSLAYMLDETGGIVSEFTITRLAADRFLLTSAAAALWHDEDWMRARLPAGGSVEIRDESAARATLALAGPRARDILSAMTDADLSNAAFPWMSARGIEIGMARVLALRVSYTGELGWELHMPAECATGVYERLLEAGAARGMVDFGLYALESMRLEKGYAAWQADLTREYTPAMAGLDRFVDLSKGAFVGRDALLREREAGGPAERLATLVVDAAPGEAAADAPTCSPVFVGGEAAGLATSGGYGHRVGASIALAYLRPDLAAPGTRLEIEILGARRPAVVAPARALYDPENARPRA